METLEVMLKLHQQKLDILTSELGKVEAKKNQLESLLEAIRDNINNESSKYQGTEYSIILERYVEVATNQALMHQEQISLLSKQTLELRQKIAKEFAELKKIEILIKNNKLKLQQLEKKREGLLLDEVTNNRQATANN
jgi:flagellar biosynthesis chaperone FliJ